MNGETVTLARVRAALDALLAAGIQNEAALRELAAAINDHVAALPWRERMLVRWRLACRRLFGRGPYPFEARR